MKHLLVKALVVAAVVAVASAAVRTSLLGGHGGQYAVSTMLPRKDASVRFTLALAHTAAQRRKLERAALDISDPTHADYRTRQPYTNAELAAMVGASPARMAAVRAFVAGDLRGRVVSVGNHGDSVVVEAPVAAVEAAFGVTVRAFSRGGAGAGAVLRATASPVVPAAMRAHVAMVAGLSVAELHAADDAKVLHPHRAAQAATSAPRDAAAGFAATAPNVVETYAGSDFVSPMIVPVCQDGLPSFATDSLCSLQPPMITKFRVTMQPIGFDNQPSGAAFSRDVAAGGTQPAPPTGSVNRLAEAARAAVAEGASFFAGSVSAASGSCPHPNALSNCLQAMTSACPNIASYASTGLQGASCQCVSAWIDCQLGAGCQNSTSQSSASQGSASQGSGSGAQTPTAMCAAYAASTPSCGVNCTGFNPVLPVPGATVSQCLQTQGTVVCQPYVFGLPRMTLFNVSVATVYADGTVSAASYNANTVITTPYLEPQVLREWYGVPSKLFGTGSPIVQGVAEFGGQYYYPPDYTTFLTNAQMPIAPLTVLGGNDPLASGDESSLDVQWIAGIGAGVSTAFDYVDGANSFVFEWAQQLVNAPTRIADVWSVSYGFGEEQYTPDAGFPAGYIARTEAEFAKLAAKRVTIIFAAGDNGASNYGRSATCTPLHPSYPSSSAWVTAVGATFLTPYSTPACATDPAACVVGEAYVRNFGASGVFWSAGSGFSNHQSQQPWQAAAVQGYLSNYSSALPM